MNYSIVAFAVLTAATLSSAFAFNVPVFGTDFKAENEEGILNIGRNDCEQKQKEFEESDGNTQSQNCEIIFNNLVENEDFTNNVVGGTGTDGPGTDDDCEAIVEVIIDVIVENEPVEEDFLILLETNLLEACEEGASPEDLIDILIDLNAPNDLLEEIIAALEDLLDIEIDITLHI